MIQYPRQVLPFLLMALLLASCATKPEDSHKRQDETAMQKETEALSPLALGLRLLALQPGGQSVVLSPESLRMALRLASSGAKGQTLQLLEQYCGNESNYPNKTYEELTIANATWLDQRFTISSAYQKNLKQQRATIAALPLQEKPAESARQINEWVHTQTQGKIDNLVSEDNLGRGVELVLTNAIHFYAEWAKPFDKEHTRQQPFYATAGRQDVPMMFQSERIAYGKFDAMQAISLNYHGGSFKMLILLPARQEMGAFDFSTLSEEQVLKMHRELREEKVDLSLPRFKVSQKNEFTQQLQTIGLKLPFTSNADFSGIPADGKSSIRLGQVLQNALIEVNEEGTEAVAATAVTAVRMAYMPPQAFVADRPFLFILYRDTPKDALFMGIYDGE